METLGAVVVLLGLALILLGGVFFIIAAFRESVLWGLGVIFLPLVSLVFLIVAWPRAKNSFFLQLYGLAALMIGALGLHAHIPVLAL
jgi:hypothetical protein